MLNSLEIAALLVKAGFASNLLEARSMLHDVEIFDHPVVFEPEVDDTEWYGGPNSGGIEGYRYCNETKYIPLGGRIFSVTKQEAVYVNNSYYDDRGEDYIKFYIAPSEGSMEQDIKRISLDRLLKWAAETKEAAPEAIELLRTEIEELRAV
jgi:hypothetical protein